jgi:dihydrofolate reductase
MKAVIACDPKGGIGYENKLPWDKIQGDLPRFKQLTDGQVIVMGRNTWESLPKKPLPNRINVVVSSKDIEGVTTIKEISKTFDDEYKSAWLIGGASLINSSWWCIDEVHLTRTFTEYTCDTYIDLVKLQNEFMCWFKETHTDHTYEIWKRK